MQQSLSAALVAAVFAMPVLAQGATIAPCFEPIFGTNLNLGDDAVAQGQALGFSFPGPGGVTTATIDISSNGFVWLGSNPDSGCCDGQEAKFLTRGPRIAPLWVDLDPSSGGAVWFNTLPAAGPIPARAVVTWDQVPEFQGQPALTFQLQLFADGSVLMFYDANALVINHVCLTGITEGNNAVPNFIDIGSTGANPHDSGTNPSVYELQYFFSDLAPGAFTFVPNGQGGYLVTQQTNCSFASVVPFGVGCPRPVTTYELFTATNQVDLSNTALEFIPNGAGGYIVTPLPGFFAGYTGAESFGDDDAHGPFNLPFTFNYPGGSTNAIDVSSNGFVWLQAGNGDPRCCNGDEFLFANDGASIAALWMDLDPTSAAPGAGIYFDVVGTTEAHITWVDVPEYFTGGTNTFQITLRSDDSFRLSWGNVANLGHDALVGFSEGSTGVIPGSLDLSAGTFVTGNAGAAPLRLAAQFGSRPVLGSTFTVEIDQITPGSALGILILGFTTFPGGLDLSPFGIQGCYLYGSLDLLNSVPLTGSPTSYSVPVPSALTLIGAQFSAQAATITPGFNPFDLLFSNGLALTLGY